MHKICGVWEKLEKPKWPARSEFRLVLFTLDSTPAIMGLDFLLESSPNPEGFLVYLSINSLTMHVK